MKIKSRESGLRITQRFFVPNFENSHAGSEVTKSYYACEIDWQKVDFKLFWNILRKRKIF